MGGWGPLLLALNGMIGAAIFGLPGKLDEAVGSFAPWLLLIAGGCVMLIALCYADLAARFDTSGGPALYVAGAFGRVAGFEAGWLIYVSRAAALGANATVLAAYAGALWPPLDSAVTIVMTILAVAIVNIAGLRPAIGLLGTLSAAKLAPLLVIVILGIGAAFPLATPTLPTFGAVESIALVALYAFVGFEAATVPAGETRNPKKVIPRALLLTVAGVTLLYVAIQLVYSAASIGASDAPLAALAAAQLGPSGATLLALTAIVSVFANQLSLVTSTARLTVGLAEQRLLPRWFAATARRFDTPANSIAALALLGLILALSGGFLFLAVVSALARLFAYLLCVAAVPRLDWIAGHMRWARGIALPIAAALPCIWAATQSRPNEWATFAALLVVGVLLFVVAGREKRG